MTTHPYEPIFTYFEAQNPHPTTELNYNSPFELLIAVLLSAQATDKSVNKATEKLFSVANTPEKIKALGEDALKQFIRTINFYPTKAVHILKTCDLLIQKHQSQVPATREALEALPGVGRKTANVLLNTLFGISTIAVDTHIFRVANRIGLASAETVRGVEDQLMVNIPPKFRKNAHHWLVLHGRYICTARNPKCDQCGIRSLCAYFLDANKT